MKKNIILKNITVKLFKKNITVQKIMITNLIVRILAVVYYCLKYCKKLW